MTLDLKDKKKTENLQWFLDSLTGPHPADILRLSDRACFSLLPELEILKGFQQNNRYHIYDVWEHTLHVLEYASEATDDLRVRLAALFHDVAKPLCYTEDSQGQGHFYGHGIEGSRIAERLAFYITGDRNLAEDVAELVLYHDGSFEPSSRYVRRWLRKIGEAQFRRLLLLHRADVMAHDPAFVSERLNRLMKLEQKLSEVILQEKEFKRSDLMIRGRDLLERFHCTGPQIGRILDRLTEEVRSGTLENTKEVLLHEAGAIFTEMVKEESE